MVGGLGAGVERRLWSPNVTMENGQGKGEGPVSRMIGLLSVRAYGCPYQNLMCVCECICVCAPMHL